MTITAHMLLRQLCERTGNLDLLDDDFNDQAATEEVEHEIDKARDADDLERVDLLKRTHWQRLGLPRPDVDPADAGQVDQLAAQNAALLERLERLEAAAAAGPGEDPDGGGGDEPTDPPAKPAGKTTKSTGTKAGS